MATAAEIAAVLAIGQNAPSENGSLEYKQGVVQSWDDIGATNTVIIGGTVVPNVRAFQSGLGIQYQPGDVVAVGKNQTTYFIMGRIAAPGAGAAQQIASASVATYEFTTNNGSFIDLTTPGPAVTTYIGSSRKCLLNLSCVVSYAGTKAAYIGGYMGFQVTGASAIAPSGFKSVLGFGYAVTGVGTTVSVSAQFYLTAADGLNQGFNTFTAKYKSADNTIAGGFDTRNITIIPL